MATSIGRGSIRTIGLTTVAMIAFAANSLLCRQAFGDHLIDAATFTTVRVVSGALTLALIVMLRRRPQGGTVDGELSRSAETIQSGTQERDALGAASTGPAE